jgi:XrtN system VIT domain protein
MQNPNPKPFRLMYRAGLLAILGSAFLYLMVPGSYDAMFFVHFTLTFLYWLALIIYQFSLPKPRPSIPYACWINIMLLLSVSAFSLNEELHVFATFPTWMMVYIIGIAVLMLLYPYYDRFSTPIKTIIITLTGCGFVMALYLFIFLLPMVPVSIAIFIVLGLSIHTFVPLGWLVFMLIFLFRKTERTILRNFFWVGLAMPLFFLGTYLCKWHSLQTQITDVIAKQQVSLEPHLPEPVSLAQKLPDDPMVELIMMSAFHAQIWRDFNGALMRARRDEIHDPLDIIAVSIFGTLPLQERTVSEILEIRKNNRIHHQEKLWTDISLSTSSIATNVQVFPSYRIAYHEKTFQIHHDNESHSRRSWFTTPTQEAHYTFHLPEGSIVTSLSLWVNGEERPSRLTTKQKADSSYKTIVGVQRRDPALVHWQEGNTITVNVFPCTPDEDRTFKIGFTTPLRYKNNMLELENVSFEGPDFQDAREVTQILIANNEVEAIHVPDHFVPTASGNFSYHGDYIPKWKFQFNSPSLSTNTFAFNGFEYSLTEPKISSKNHDIQTIYLDINEAWSRQEFDQIIDAFPGKTIKTWTPEEVTITAKNQDLVWQETHCNIFSVPCLYQIKQPENAVIITQTSDRSPILKDLKTSPYGIATSNYLQQLEQKLFVIDIGNEQSPFWKSLLELRYLDYHQRSIQDALSMLQSGSHNTSVEDSSNVVIHHSNLCVTKTATTDTTKQHNGPDHLLRLFGYNNAMRQIGNHYFSNTTYDQKIFADVEEAYVVTPISSLIVLETDQDYDNFDIKENVKTIGNAGIIGGGAVPEPHEWALLLVTISLILRHIYITRFRGNG